MACCAKVDKMLANQAENREQILQTQKLVNEQAAKTRQKLAEMEAKNANRTKEQTQQLVAKIDEAQKEQNARLAYMMQSQQCNAEMQTAQLKEFVGEKMAELQSAVLSGTGAQIDAAVDKLTDTMNANRYILEEAIKTSTASTHELINERFGELSTRMDAVDESLKEVQDLLDETLSRLDKTDQRIADLSAQSQSQFRSLRSGRHAIMGHSGPCASFFGDLSETFG